MNSRHLPRLKKFATTTGFVILLNIFPTPEIWSHESDSDNHRNVHLQVRLEIVAATDALLKKAWVGSYSLELLPCAPQVSSWQRLSPVSMAYANHGESFTTPLQWKLARLHALNTSHEDTLVDATIPAGRYCSMMLTWGHPQLNPEDKHYSAEIGRYSFQLETADGQKRQAMNAFSQFISLPQPIGENDLEQIKLRLEVNNVVQQMDWQKSPSHFMSDWFRQLGNEIKVQI